MVSLPAVEEALASRFQGPEEDGPVLAVEAREAGSAVELTLFTTRGLGRESANAAIREAGLGPLHNIRKVVDLEAIPLLGTGKIDYRALKAMLA